MANYKTPGVYVVEEATLPPSVAEVSTAIPAFIGYTEKVPLSAEGTTVVPYVARISTLLEYETLFGGAKKSTFAVATEPELKIVRPEVAFFPLTYYSLSLYFQNGGGSCYVVSIGSYNDDLTQDKFLEGLKLLKMEDEPTLILFPDAVNLAPTDYYAVCVQALNQCAELKDRFCILDVHNKKGATYQNSPIADFRQGIQNNYLLYGAAYHPYLQTAIPYVYDEAGVLVEPSNFEKKFKDKGISVKYVGESTSEPKVSIILHSPPADTAKTSTLPTTFSVTASPPLLTIDIGYGEDGKSLNAGNAIARSWEGWAKDNPLLRGSFSVNKLGDGSDLIEAHTNEALEVIFEKTLGTDLITVTYRGQIKDEPKVLILYGNDKGKTSFSAASNTLTITMNPTNNSGQIAKDWEDSKPSGDLAKFTITASGSGKGIIPSSIDNNGTPLFPFALDALKSLDTGRYNQIKAALSQERVILPPSPAIAGIYASVDRTRGVWKAPANVSLASVIGPVSKITNNEQDDLNVDPTTGKSINAIRSFTGKGTLVWGARTLAGNDNEWRYINVRRLFNVIEESIQKATAFAVFEANDATTWLKVKAMIESYLFGLWERGALAGPTSAAAYFVNVGLGKTMTTQDILEGRMNVKVGVAAVRPAEFIILTFTHKLQEA